MLNGIFFGILVAFGTAGYFYYTQSEAELAQLRLENATYKDAVETQQDTIAQLQTSMETQGEELNRLSSVNSEIQAEMNRYLGIFRRHNLSKLADAKPGLIEKRANNGTQKVFDSIRDDTTIE